jgi:hypothetical protein
MDRFTTAEPPRAAILHFPKKRGRPRIQRPMRDSGTPELVMKRARQETAEAFDLCLERGIITPEQHWCGIHLRWLYTLRYGAPGVRALDPTHLGGREVKLDDPDWRIAREMEYTTAIQALNERGATTLLLSLCIHNERPAFLRRPTNLSRPHGEKTMRDIRILCDGLDTLDLLWRR